MMVTAYPQPGKARSRAVLEAFAQGCGGAIVGDGPAGLSPGAAAFYGLVGIEHLLNLAIAEEREFFYGDNGHFDVSRQRYFRFAKNSFQITFPKVAPNALRFQQTGAELKPWTFSGNHIVVVEQSEHFLSLSGAGRNWLERTVLSLKQHTDRPIVIRRWRRDKDKASATLRADLRGAWALVTHMSAAATEAVLAGVPVFVSGRCAALPMASGELSKIENPKRPEGREDWAGRLAASQWTLEELYNGDAWRILQNE